MSVQQALMTVIAKPNAKIRLAITSVLANKDFMEMEGQAAQVKKNLEKSKIHVQSIDLFFLWAFLIRWMCATSLSAHSLNSWCLFRQTQNLSCKNSVLPGFSAFAPGSYVKSYSGSLDIDECKEGLHDCHSNAMTIMEEGKLQRPERIWRSKRSISKALTCFLWALLSQWKYVLSLWVHSLNSRCLFRQTQNLNHKSKYCS